MTEIVSVISGKGGVGKTTVVSNLAVALTEIDKKVLVIDSNVSGANLGLHLGVPSTVSVTLNDVLREDSFITEAIYKHHLGFGIIPASLVELNADSRKLKKLMFDLVGSYDHIIIDAGVGVNREVESAIRASDKVLIVTNPELPALTNALHAKRLAEKLNKDVVRVIINRKSNEKFELKVDEITKFLETDLVSVVPEHKKVREGIALGKPIVEYKPHNDSSFAFKNIARNLTNSDEIRPNTFEKIKQLIDRI